MDCHPAVRHLADPALAKVVADTIYHFAGERYDLLAYAVMPSHLHWVFRPIVGQVSNLSGVGQVPNLSADGVTGNDDLTTGWETCPTKHERSELERIMHSLKLHTARECNRVLRQRGQFWQDESYDHCVRDEEKLERVIQYVEQNPVKAGLAKTAEQWSFSSAHDRALLSVPFGSPLARRTGL